MVTGRPGWVVLFWVATAGAMGFIAPNLTRLAVLGQANLLDGDAESKVAGEALRLAWPDQAYESLVVAAVYRSGGLTAADLGYAVSLAKRFRDDDRPTAILRVLGPDSPPEVASRLLSRQGIHVTARIAGENAESADIRALIRSDQAQSWYVVPVGVFLVLLLALRDPLVCLNLVGTMILTYAFALGATHLLFVTILGAAGIDWKVSYFLLVQPAGLPSTARLRARRRYNARRSDRPTRAGPVWSLAAESPGKPNTNVSARVADYRVPRILLKWLTRRATPIG